MTALRIDPGHGELQRCRELGVAWPLRLYCPEIAIDLVAAAPPAALARRSPLLVGPDNRRRSGLFTLSVMQVLHGAQDSVISALLGAPAPLISNRSFYFASVGALCSTASDGSSRRGGDARIGLVCR